MFYAADQAVHLLLPEGTRLHIQLLAAPGFSSGALRLPRSQNCMCWAPSTQSSFSLGI